MTGAPIVVGETINFVVRSDAKTMTFFSDKLYTNKIESAVREIIHNGRDSQIENGNGDEPLVIHFPSVPEPYFSVTDNGLGMSHTFVTSTFVTYSESTKDGPVTAKDVVGKLGLGSKSPMAVSDEYFVASRHDGVLTRYRIFKTNQGTSLEVISSEATDARNGVEVRWAVHANHFTEYKRALAKVLTYLPPAPVIENVAKDFAIVALDIGFEGEGYRIRNQERSFRSDEVWARAIMGGVIYPIKADEISGMTEDQRALLELPIDIDFPLGDIDFDLGRERLSYDFEQTQPNLKRRFAEVLRDLRKRIDADYRDCETFYEAAHRLKMKSMRDKIYARILRVVGARWRKRDISNGGFHVKLLDFPSMTGISYAFSARHSGSDRFERTIKTYGVFHYAVPDGAGQAAKLFVPASQNLHIFRDDLDKGTMVRFKEVLDRCRYDGAFIALIRCDDADFARLQAELDGVEIGNISEIERPKAERPRLSVRKLVSSQYEGGLVNKDTVYPVDVDMAEGGLYVVTRNNELRDISPGVLSKRYSALVRTGHFDPKTENFVIVPVGLEKNFAEDEQWKSAIEVFAERANAALAEQKTGIEIEKSVQYSAYMYDRYEDRPGSDLAHVTDLLAEDHPLRAFQDLVWSYASVETSGRKLAQLAEAYGRTDEDRPRADLGPSLDERFNALSDRYPLVAPSLKGIRRSRIYDDAEKARHEAFYQHLADYVAMVDGADSPAPQAAPVPAGQAQRRKARTFGYVPRRERRNDRKASARS